jgi:hypothetical protein
MKEPSRTLILAFLISIGSFILPANSTPWDSTDGEVTIVRQMPSQATSGETITIEVTLTVGTGITDPIKGFYLADEIPEDLTIETSSYTATLNGSGLTSIMEETGSASAVYPSAVSYRLILETPPGFTEHNALQAGDELMLTYWVTIPSDAATGTTYIFPGYSWIGRILSNPVEDIFGYEDHAISMTVVSDASTTTITTTVPTTTTTTVTGKPVPCAVEETYGEDSEKVKRLRNYRDEVLTKTPKGRTFIKLFYQFSPLVVKRMAEDSEFREQFKRFCDLVVKSIDASEK